MRCPWVFVFLFPFTTLFAQPWDTLSLRALSDFSDAGKNWKIVGAVESGPESATFRESTGTGVLLNQPRGNNQADLRTTWTHGDLDIELEFMLSAGTNSGIYLQGNYEVQLFDSWGRQRVGFGDLGGIYQRYEEASGMGYEGYAPAINAAKAPGLWQHLSISFRAPKFDAYGRKIQNAQLLAVILNGVMIHENIELTGPTRGSWSEEVARGPLRIQGDHGPVALRHIRFRRFDRPPLVWEDLGYEVARISDKYSRAFPKDAKSLAAGSTSSINTDLTGENEKLAMRFSGTLDLPVEGVYSFAMQVMGNANLYIDGKEYLHDLWGRKEVQLSLSEGKHQVEVVYLKYDPWYPKLLALYVGGPGLALQPLHKPESLPFGRSGSPIFVDFDREPVLLRSYTDVPQKGGGVKRINHGVHVGFPSGIAYTYHLGTGNLLQTWRGGFMETTPMWSGRGDGSARPIGVVNFLDTLTGWTAATNGSFAPQLTEEHVRPRGYRLDETGIPTFNYEIQGAKVSDHIVPLAGGKGLQRTIQWEGTPAQSGTWRLASGEAIAAVDQRRYRVADRFFIELPEKSKTRVEIRSNGGLDELVATATDGQRLIYSIIW